MYTINNRRNFEFEKKVKHIISYNAKDYACLIDYEKAFDIVNRNLLLKYLKKTGARQEQATTNTVSGKKQSPADP